MANRIVEALDTETCFTVDDAVPTHGVITLSNRDYDPDECMRVLYLLEEKGIIYRTENDYSDYWYASPSSLLKWHQERKKFSREYFQEVRGWGAVVIALLALIISVIAILK